jgi:hypothetical protein
MSRCSLDTCSRGIVVVCWGKVLNFDDICSHRYHPVMQVCNNSMTNFKIPCKAIKCKFKLVCQEAMIIQVNTCFYFDKLLSNVCQKSIYFCFLFAYTRICECFVEIGHLLKKTLSISTAVVCSAFIIYHCSSSTRITMNSGKVQTAPITKVWYSSQ